MKTSLSYQATFRLPVWQWLGGGGVCLLKCPCCHRISYKSTMALQATLEADVIAPKDLTIFDPELHEILLELK